jgi:hypothetical protein
VRRLLVSLTVLVVLAVPTAAAAYPFAATIDYWRVSQKPDGAIIGPSGKPQGYGTIMMGAAFAQAGLLASAGLATTNWVANGPDDPFSLLAATVVYERADADVRATLGPAIRSRLDAALPKLFLPYADNWSIVAAAAAIRADQLGIGPYRLAAETWIVSVYLPVLRRTHGFGGDLNTWPLAYHAFATGLLAMIGASAVAPSIHTAAIRSCRVIQRTMSPTGIVAWYGRSQLESFAQASAVLALRSCEQYASPAETGRFEVAAHRAETALARQYPTLASGRLAIIPRYAFDPTPYRGADHYAHEEGYTALTLVLLGLAPPWRGLTSHPDLGYVAPLGDRAPAVVASRVLGGWVGLSVRRGWTTLSRSGPRDGRYGFGVQRAETTKGRVIVPAAAIESPADLDLPAATRVVTNRTAVTAFGPGYTVRFWIRGCSVFEKVRVRRRQKLTVGGRLALDAGGHRLGALRTSRPLLFRQFWKAYGADSRRLQNVRGIVRLPAHGTVVIEHAGCR